MTLEYRQHATHFSGLAGVVGQQQLNFPVFTPVILTIGVGTCEVAAYHQELLDQLLRDDGKERVHRLLGAGG